LQVNRERGSSFDRDSEGDRVIARQASAPRAVELAEYEGPIVRAFAERSGRAPRGRFSLRSARRWPIATAPPTWSRADQTPRWKPRLGKARIRLVRRGWLVSGSSRTSCGLRSDTTTGHHD
jgi:hypothetical protein